MNSRQEHLLKVLQNQVDEMTGQQLHQSLKGGPAEMGLATVYRNLRRMQLNGLVRCRHLPSGEALYAPVERDRHHITCVDCGQTRPLKQCPIHDLTIPADACSDFNLLFHTLEFFGICNNCRQRQETLS